MKARLRTAAGAVVLLAVLGCAQTRPCMIIPAEIDLARHTRDQAKTDMQAKQDELKRAQETLKLSSDWLTQLVSDRNDLKSVLEIQPATPDQKGGTK